MKKRKQRGLKLTGERSWDRYNITTPKKKKEFLTSELDYKTLPKSEQVFRKKQKIRRYEISIQDNKYSRGNKNV